MGTLAAIIQARTGSTRLPHKMDMPFYENKSVLEILIERLKDALLEKGIDIILATTTNPNDDPIYELCKKFDIKSFRGSESDVLKRFIGAAEKYSADKIIRICADNVFLDTKSLLIVAENLNNTESDYVSFKKEDGTPSILTHYGFFCEGVRLQALKDAYMRTSEPIFHEHVTNYIYSSPDRYRIKLINIEDTIPGLEEKKHLRLTLDTKEDFDVQKIIYTYLLDKNLPVTPLNIIEYIDNINPYLYEIMAKTIKENSK